jgi:multisubunit Na+/H+ antiporter MnhB subunit
MPRSETFPRSVSALYAALLAALAGVFALVILDLPAEPGGLTAAVIARLPESGVEHPVTAVLLNFRAYDTWLELGVLLLGMLGVWALRGEARLAVGTFPPPGAVLYWLVGGLAPLMVLVAGYFLWLGKFAPGGAFQAGVVLAAAGVLLWYSGRRGVGMLPLALLRVLLVAGFGGFLLVAVATTPTVGILRMPRAGAGTVIVALETLATVSIAITIAAILLAMQEEASSTASGDS